MGGMGERGVGKSVCGLTPNEKTLVLRICQLWEGEFFQKVPNKTWDKEVWTGQGEKINISHPYYKFTEDLDVMDIPDLPYQPKPLTHRASNSLLIPSPFYTFIAEAKLPSTYNASSLELNNIQVWMTQNPENPGKLMIGLQNMNINSALIEYQVEIYFKKSTHALI